MPEMAPYQGGPSLSLQHVAPDHTLEPGAEQIVLAGLSANTRKAYRIAWAAFENWCGERGRTALPATEETLVSYIDYMARHTDCSPETAKVAMAAIRRAHRMRRPPLPWPDSEFLTDAMRGLRLLRIEQGYRPRRATAARSDVIRLLADACDVSTPTGLRDRALILLGYRFAARRSELGTLRLADLTFTPDGLDVFLAKSKTDQQGHGATTAVPFGRDPVYCTVLAVKAWLDVLASHGIVEGALFRPVRYNKPQQKGIGPSYRMSGTAIEQIFQKAVVKAKADGGSLIGKLVPHSLRRGWATDARAAGADIIDIARGGRWSKRSAVVLDYMDDVDRWKSNPNNNIDL